MKSLNLFLFSFLLTLSFVSSAQQFGNLAKREINKAPLKIQQVQFEVKNSKEALVTLFLELAKDHKAYDDIFKISHASNKKWSFSEPQTEPIKSYKDKFSNNKERLVFEGNGTMRFLAKNSKGFSGPEDFQLTYQACTEDYCLLPINLDFKIAFRPSSNTEKPEQKSQSLKDQVINNLGKGSLITFLLIYLFGLMTSLTPCIYPMIPLTIGILGVSDTSSRLKGLIIGIFYALGMSLVYASFGLLVAFTGGFIGQALTNSYVVWGIFAFYLAMAASMFGLFEIQAPGFISQKFSRINFKGPLGAFVAGLISGLIASPCVGPVVAAILGYAGQSGDPLYGFTALFCFGMGIGTLFIFMGVFYGELNSKLRPGKWVSYVKYALGVFILIGAFIFIKPHLPFLNESSTQILKEGWKNYSPSLVEQAKKDKKKVIIDFHASWCTACHELEEKVFAKKEFKEATKDLLLLSFDATKPDKEQQKVLNEYFVIGLPTILFINSNGQVEKDLTLTGFEEWIDFQKRIEQLK